MNLLFFILGAFSTDIINPILTEVCNLVCTIIETYKGKFAVKIAEYNKKVVEIQGEKEDEEKEPVHIMGFHLEPEERETERELEEEKE